MEQVSRYIYAVTQKLPKQQRADIEQELRGLIEDMIEERVRGGEDAASAVEQVLLELGNPHDLAAKYRGEPRYLIGPLLFDTYLSVLKIILICIVLIQIVVFGISFILDPTHVQEQFNNLIRALIFVPMEGFAWTTLTFAFLDYAMRKEKKSGIVGKSGWHPAKLPPIPDSKWEIKQSESLLGIMFTIFFLVLFTFSPHLIGATVFSEGNLKNVIPFFTLEVFREYLPFIWLLGLLGLFKDSVRWVKKSWTNSIFLTHILFTIISGLFGVYMFANPELYNAEFLDELVMYGLVEAGSEKLGTLAKIWSLATEWIVYLIGASTLIEVIQTGVKWIRFRRNHGSKIA